MASKYLEAGKIVNTHGVRGEVKIQPWADSPAFLASFERFYIDGAPVGVTSAKVHKGCIIAAFDGVSDFDGAIKLKNKTVFIDRSDAQIGEGRHFVADLIGLLAIDAETGAELGHIDDVLSLPSNDVYVIRGSREILVPAVPDFIDETNIDGGFVRIRLREGL
ncbi:MAG: ribosome maturation factor RimM [Oscillospiraceae bacterium]|jgi:16S rRNA processing protein RimM|nr:ribosome maturation factor RimM [Oscillospiraceae bacterium]